jgi:hypothetical protein
MMLKAHEAIKSKNNGVARKGLYATKMLRSASPKRVISPLAMHFTRSQVVNASRNLESLRLFRAEDFGSQAGCPSSAHLDAVNKLISRLRQYLQGVIDRLSMDAMMVTPHNEDTHHLARVLIHRQKAERVVKLIEKIWAFYLELFGQRQTPFAGMLLAADRIALDAYQTVYLGLGTARSIPSPAAFTYMETGFTPATFRRGIPLSRLGKQLNPFPVISLPYHRLVNSWTLGAIPHEVSHNLQFDLGLWDVVPKAIARSLLGNGVDSRIAGIWARWHKEIWADLCGLLLAGPAVVTSLLDVVARSPLATTSFNPAGVHPTSYLRVLINLELLRRMGFGREAHNCERLWKQLYPDPEIGGLPPAMLASFPKASALVVDTICYQPFPQLGGKALANVVRFTEAHQAMSEEAARRLALGLDPGIIPARFLIAAARIAFDQQLASPDAIARHFYRALSQR